MDDDLRFSFLTMSLNEYVREKEICNHQSVSEFVIGFIHRAGE